MSDAFGWKYMGLVLQRHDDQGPANDAEVAEWLGAAAHGDQEAWRRLVECYSRRVYALARSRLRSPELAEEITQSVFATVAAKLCGGEYSEQGRFESWLFRVGMNRVRDEVRRSARQAATADPETFSGIASREPAEAKASLQDLAAMRLAIERLTESEQETIHLRHHAGLSFKQISDLMEEPLGTVLARHHRALRKLRTMLTNTTDEQALSADGADGRDGSMDR